MGRFPGVRTAMVNQATYASIVVHVDLGSAAQRRVAVASELATRFGARLRGVAAEAPFPSRSRERVVTLPEQFGEHERRWAAEEFDRVAKELKQAEALFRGSAGTSRLEWRSEAQECPAFLIEQSSPGDLIVVGRQRGDEGAYSRVGISLTRVLLDLSCPMLLVPPNISELSAGRIIVAWNGSEEVMRAVSGAMPFLQQARQVILVSIEGGSGALLRADVVAHLKHEGVRDVSLVHVPRRTASVASHIFEASRDAGADLIVAGAYGHSPMREWLFGGTTRELLSESTVCCLLAR
jgi:nucleotide-binding universal stress UspA family protein